MTSTLAPDPYAALGVPKDASSAIIKSAYRKLALKCHPDKVTDESLKKQKQEEFHRIQEAYELIGEEDKRKTYDAEVRLEQLRRDKLARGGPNVEVRTARYDVRTAAPAGATYTTNGPHRYEERKPTTSRSFEDDRYYEDRSRKYDTYEAYPKHSTSSRTTRSEKEPIRASKTTSDRTRSDQKKTRDKEERRDRKDKFSFVEENISSADEKAQYEAGYRRRSDDARRRQDEDSARKDAADARKKAEGRRSYEETKEPHRQRSDERERELDPQRKTDDLANDAVRYIHRSRVEIDRPSPSRTTSSRDVRPNSYDRSRRDRPPEPRRSSHRRDRPEAPSRDRKTVTEIVDWEEEGRRPIPSFQHANSSPADLHVPPPPRMPVPQRSYTESSRDHRRTATSPPGIRRSDTEPASSSSRRKEEFVSRPSILRSSESATAHFGSPPEPAFPTVPPPQTSSSSRKYYYTPTKGGVTLLPEDVKVANGPRIVTREPERHRPRPPSPLGRPPYGANRPTETTSAHYTTATPNLPRSSSYAHAPPHPPPLARAATMAGDGDRGRTRLYGEIPRASRDENYRRQTSFSPDPASYSRKFRNEDINWAHHGKPRDFSRDERHAPVGVC